MKNLFKNAICLFYERISTVKFYQSFFTDSRENVINPRNYYPGNTEKIRPFYHYRIDGKHWSFGSRQLGINGSIFVNQVDFTSEIRGLYKTLKATCDLNISRILNPFFILCTHLTHGNLLDSDARYSSSANEQQRNSIF